MKEIYVDIIKGTVQTIVTTEKDNLTNNYRIIIVQDGKRVDLTGKTLKMVCINQENRLATILYLTVTNATQGEAQLQITKELTVRKGVLNCQIAIFDETGFLETTGNLSLYVRDSLFVEFTKLVTDKWDFEGIDKILQNAEDYGKKIPAWQQYFDSVKSAEDERVKAEETRVQTEKDRATAEQSRVNAESNRVDAENTRNSQEQIRQQHYTDFDNAEASRVQAEESRVKAETLRVNAEANRVNAENLRTSAEANRETSEKAREDFINNSAKPVVDKLNDFDTKLSNDIQKVYQTINDGSFIPFTGTDITVDNSKEGFTKDIIVKGQTIQNLINGNPFYTGANTALFHSELSKDNAEITITRTQTGAIGWQYVGVPINNDLLKNNTTYTVIFYANGNCECDNAYVDLMEGSSKNMIGGLNAPRKKGLNKYKFTTDHNTKPQKQILYIGLVNSELNNVNDSMTLSDFYLLEGDWTDKEISGEYFKGIKSVAENNQVSILSYNKNLFNTSLIKGDISPVDGVQAAVTSHAITKDFIKVKPNKSIALSYTAIVPPKWTAIFFYDKNFKYISYNDGELTVTTPGNCYYIKFKIENSANSDIKDCQVEYSSAKTSYVEHKDDKKEIKLSFNGGLKSILDETCDTIEQRKDEIFLVQRVNNIILDGDENWTLVNSSISSSDLITFELANTTFLLPKSLGYGNCICNIISNNTYNTIYNNDVEGIGIKGYSNNTTIIRLNINKSKLTTQDTEGLKEFIKANPITIYYELATPLETKLDIDTLNLETFKDLTYVSSNNSIAPILEFKAPVDVTKTIADLKVANTNLIAKNKQLQAINALQNTKIDDLNNTTNLLLVSSLS